MSDGGAAYFAGVDGGGTRTTVALADDDGREIVRRSGSAGLVDPRRPTASAEVVAALVREAVDEAGLDGPAEVLCAGLAGVGNPAEREEVRAALEASGVARRVMIVTDGEAALEGALGGGAGVLLVAGTGSVAYGRAEDGRVERCGGWGLIIGDEGSAYQIGRAALAAAVRSDDGRGPATRLLPELMREMGVDDPRAIPPWVGRVEKADVAALATAVIAAADAGDAVALRVAEGQARELAQHALALAQRLVPWAGEIPVVFHGGVLGAPLYARLVTRALTESGLAFSVRDPVADAVTGSLRYARGLVAAV
ncbi:MAG TPA: BadF/BadG/BcrA/BcrD ATPase family protein [Longimicrobiaceae bacterium]|jgi:glucosamine kinase|nr:BadF/BadG/BcrA/BcrD ATPase family protein [Longimicrobiaceae bacterium]